MDQVQTNKAKVTLIILSLLLGGAILFAAGFATAMALVFYFGALENRSEDAPTYSDDFGGGGIDGIQALKPAIYLYPTETKSVAVQLDYDGVITTDIPEYDSRINGWHVTAQPDGTLTAQDGKNYPYLFWEGKPNYPERYAHPRTGFVVAGKDAAQFLQTTLPKLGLSASEAREFIEFWLPKLQRNNYNLIHFAGAEYLAEAQLTVEPQPDSTIRVFMVVHPLNQPVSIPEQSITTPVRHGFTVVEWGGMILP